jgi:FAD:protein FMN transferase
MRRIAVPSLPLYAALALLVVAVGLQVGATTGLGSGGAPSAEFAATPLVAEFQFHQEGILGTSLDLTVACRDQAQADAAYKTVLDEIERLRTILSTYDPASEISRVMASRTPVRVSPELLEVLQTADAWRTRSGGAFNAQLGDLIALWSSAAKADRLPDADALQAAATRAAQPLWQIDPQAGTVLRLADVRPNIDALAKGYILEKAVRAAQAKDPTITGLLLAIGGDIRTVGSPAEGPGAAWLVGVTDPHHNQDNAAPLARIRLADAAVTTSGHYGHYYTIGGRQYSHIFDPRTGRSVQGVAGATAVAPDAATADALSTTLCVLAPEDGLRLVASVPGAQCLIVADDGRTFASPGWQAMAAPAPAAAASAPRATGGVSALPGATGGLSASVAATPTGPAATPTAPAVWPVGYSVNLIVDLVAKGKRPYVAVWAENAAGKPVRTIAVWGNEQKYLKELSAWWGLYRTQAEVIKATTRATRVAGKYMLAWDGLDDAGKPLPPGKYTIRIETAQEDGGHLGITGVIACEKAAASVEVAGNKHIKSVVIAFGTTPPPIK